MVIASPAKKAGEPWALVFCRYCWGPRLVPVPAGDLTGRGRTPAQAGADWNRQVLGWHGPLFAWLNSGH